MPDDAVPEHFRPRLAFLLEHVEPGQRVVDLGCGSGEFSAALARAGCRPIGIEVAAEPLRRAAGLGLDLRLYDGVAALPDCEAIWAGEVLEHVQDCATLLALCHAALVPGGSLLLTTPDHRWPLLLGAALLPRRFEAAFDPRSDHVRFFNARSLRRLLCDAGFAVIAIRRTRAGLLVRAGRRPDGRTGQAQGVEILADPGM